jgi:hypothetical protein
MGFVMKAPSADGGKRCAHLYFRLRLFFAAFSAPMIRPFFSPHALQSAVRIAPGTGR